MTFHVRSIGQHGMALDRASPRTFDADGRLHVTIANISKANVCDYQAEEIPDWQALGLQRGRIYKLLRPADELAKAAATFNNIPLLSEHVPVDARDHRPDLVIGAIGSQCKFVTPYLQNSLVCWVQDAIDGIQSGKKRELSSAYRYTADMTPGNFEGFRFDGRMVEIVGNHVALVPEGRVGPDVALDSALRRRGYSIAEEQSFAARHPHAARIKIAL
jgi:uncharacterized protein